MHENELLDGRYRLIQKKGRGSYGEVWLARDEHLGIEVAVKVYFALDDEGNEELKKEFLNTFELNHPNLLRSTYFGVCDGRSYIIMPYCPTTAAQYVGCCNTQMAWEFVNDVANGLAYLHDSGIVHHDIKPDNILIGVDGRYVISDFGISTNTRDTLRRNSGRDEDNSGMAGGAIAYMGPEMFTESPFSVNATDIWALGASVYEMVTGTLPFFGQGGAMQNNGAQLPEVPFNFISPNLVSLIHDCLAKEPWERPMANVIAKYAKMALEDEGSAPSWKEYFQKTKADNEEQEREDEATPKRRWWIGVAAAVVVLVGVGLAYLFYGRQPQPAIEDGLAYQPADTLLYAEAVIEPAEATFLMVNGSEQPRTVSVESDSVTRMVSIETDGMFTVTDDLPTWLSLSMVTDSSFVLHLERNNTANKRSKTLEVQSGSIVRKITIVQAPDKEMARRSKLSPATNSLHEVMTKNIDTNNQSE